METWREIYKHLEMSDVRSLALAARCVGVFAQTFLHEHVRTINVRDTLPFLTYSASAFFTNNAKRISSLTFSLTQSPNHGPPTTLRRWLEVLPMLTGLKSLTLLGDDIPEHDAVDVLHGCPHSSLTTFRCESDALMYASWDSLLLHEDLEEFGGLYHLSQLLPFDMSPDRFPRLRILDTGVPFLLNLHYSRQITHLSVRLDARLMTVVINIINECLASKLLSLRFDRVLPDVEWEPRDDFVTDSPLLICATLEGSALRSLVIKDTAVMVRIVFRVICTRNG